MKPFLRSVAKQFKYAVAGLIVLAAIMIGVSRLVMPALDKHRLYVENWASQLLGVPVKIEKVGFSWYIYQPQINLKHITVLQKDSPQPILQIKKVSLFFSIPQSLWQRKLVPSAIIVSGTDLNFYRLQNGEIAWQGFSSKDGVNDQAFKKETMLSGLLAWLFQQPRLILRGINLHYTSLTGEKNFITLSDLYFVNAGSQHTLHGKTVLHQAIPTELNPTELNVALQWKGELTDFTSIHAKAYVYVSGVALAQWMKGLTWQGWQVDEGIASAKIWLMWREGKFEKIQSTFQAYRLNLYSQTDKSTHSIQRLSGNIGWKREGNNQVIAADDILIDLPQHLWPATSVYIALRPETDTSRKTTTMKVKAINLGYVDLNDVQPFLFSSPPFLAATTQQLIKDLQIKGSLENAAATFSDSWLDWKHTALNANFSQLSFSAWQQLPGVRHLSGEMKWNGTHGEVTLNSKRVTFQYDKLFLYPLNIDQLQGRLQLMVDNEQAWTLRTSGLQLANDDVYLNAKAAFTFPTKGMPIADLKADFKLQNAAHVLRYLPGRILNPKLVEWLQSAFLAGEVTAGQALLHGPLAEFPFDKHNGTFSIAGNVNDIDFQYAPNWPRMRHVKARLNFTGKELTIDIDKAQMLAIPLANLHGVISNFNSAKPQVLQVHSDSIRTDFIQALRFIHASPLEATIGKMFAGLALQGPLDLKLDLTVPLKDPEKTQVQGKMNIVNTTMTLTAWHLNLLDLNGQLQFTEDTVTAEKIQARLFGKRFQFNLMTNKKSQEAALIRASFTTNLEMNDLEKWLNMPFTEVVNGATAVDGDIDLSLKAPMALQLRSTLLGLVINLPGHYAKKATESRDFLATVIAEEQQPLRMKLQYGNLLSAALVINGKENNFLLTGANLRLGGGSVDWPDGAGLYITGDIAYLDWEKINLYFNHSGKNPLPTMGLQSVDIHVDELDLGTQHLANLRVHVLPADDSWHVDVSSPDIMGKIQVPMDFTPRSWIRAQFNKLILHSVSTAKSTAPTINLQSLPSISFTANEVRYDDIALGMVTFTTVPSAEGILIRRLTMVSPRIILQAVGHWLQRGNRYITLLQGRATTTRLSNLLNSMRLDAHNFIANEGRLTFKLSWQDAPFAPALASLNGHATLAVGKGRIVDIGEENDAKMNIGRMLSILSLQTIPRRLTLDFSDLFHKGYSFDYVRGDFHFRDGDSYTNNMVMDGPVAKVGINGRIGLTDKDYDFNLSITPYVTSSLSIAATLLSAGNPIVGAAAFAVGSLLGPQVSKAVTYYYLVTGPWNDPNWKPVSGGR